MVPVEERPAVWGSRADKKEQAIWQRRFWEHCIRDELDFARHVDDIHDNPVKHGYVARPVDWPYSNIHRSIRQGVVDENWASGDIVLPQNNKKTAPIPKE